MKFRHRKDCDGDGFARRSRSDGSHGDLVGGGQAVPSGVRVRRRGWCGRRRGSSAAAGSNWGGAAGRHGRHDVGPVRVGDGGVAGVGLTRHRGGGRNAIMVLLTVQTCERKREHGQYNGSWPQAKNREQILTAATGHKQ